MRKRLHAGQKGEYKCNPKMIENNRPHKSPGVFEIHQRTKLSRTEPHNDRGRTNYKVVLSPMHQGA